MSLRTFLASLRTDAVPLRFVAGNQSADMDSVVSALSYAYFATYHDPSTPVIPLINIPRADMRLRRDIAHVLREHNLTDDLLYFSEDFARLTRQGHPAQLTLVDHCNVQGDAIIAAHAAHAVEVVGIIDHHADEGFAPAADPRIIRPNGSCSSLVFDYWFARCPEAFSVDVVRLLAAPLLIDTSNMTQKVEHTDEVVYRRIEEILGAKVALTAFYDQIKAEKKNLSGFVMTDLLRKDYKQFTFASRSPAGSPRVGFSSLSKPFAWLVKHYGAADVAAACAELCRQNVLDALVVTTSYTRRDTGQYSREFAYSFRRDNSFAPLWARLASLVPALDLHVDWYGLEQRDIDELNTTAQTVKVYNQHNVAASRKQVVPAVKSAVDSPEESSPQTHRA
ncbi:DHHA2 domain-containing protein [[Candida] zeylanoides]